MPMRMDVWIKQAQFNDNLMLTKTVWMDQWIEVRESEKEEEELKMEDIEYKIGAYDLLNMFNEVSVEMIQLLDYSFNRYKNALNDKDYYFCIMPFETNGFKAKAISKKDSRSIILYVGSCTS